MSLAESTTAPARKIVGGSVPAACPCCGGSRTEQIYRVELIPVHSCVLLDTREAATSFPLRDLELARCMDCGFSFNHLFDEEVMGYSTNFEESQHFSGTFNSFARGLALEIADKCATRGKHIIEIGCGKGEFLAELCRVGGATGLGIDPGYRADPGRGTGEDGLEFIVDHFGPRYQHLIGDVILCRHTLEHIAPVSSFIRDIRDMIGDLSGTSVVFETPDFERVLREGAFWDIYYEHCSYFSSGTHARLFRQERFDVTEIGLVYDNQYIVQYTVPAPGPTAPRFDNERDLDMLAELYEVFPARVAEIKARWLETISTAHNEGRRVALWGGGSKAVSFLTTLGLGEEISAVIDINPYKQCRFTAGTGHAVSAPSALTEVDPELVIVMNPIYVDEVRKSLHELGLDPEVTAV